MIDKERQVLEIINRWSGVDGSHHKQWVIDQIVRVLTGEGYQKWVEDWEDGEEGPETYKWDEGIAP